MENQINIEELNNLAEQGDVTAIRNLADYYNDKENFKDALNLYLKIAEQNDAEVLMRIGYCYHSLNVYGKAFELFQKSANLGNAMAQRWMGNYYIYGNGVVKDMKKAIEWYTKAAEQGEVVAQHNLGYYYEHGEGVEQDYKKSVEWYTKAAEQGKAIDQDILGDFYYNGQGVEQDYEKAVEWFTKAAENDFWISQNKLGTCYKDGIGVEQNYELAAKWYKKAANHGDKEAKELLKRLLNEDYFKVKKTDDSVFDRLEFEEKDGCIFKSFSIPFNKKGDGEMMIQCGEDEEITDAQREAYKRYTAGLDNYKKNMPQALLSYYKDNYVDSTWYNYINDALKIDNVTEESLCNALNIKCLYIERDGSFGWLAEIASKSHAVTIILSADTIKVHKGWALNSVRHGHITDEVLGDLHLDAKYRKWIKYEKSNINGYEEWYEIKIETNFKYEITPEQRENYLDYKNNEDKYLAMMPDALLKYYKDSYDFIEECWNYGSDNDYDDDEGVPTEYDYDHITKEDVIRLVDCDYMLFKKDGKRYGWVASSDWGSNVDMDVSTGVSFMFSKEEGVIVGSDEDLWNY